MPADPQQISDSAISRTLHAGYRPQQLPRLRAHALGMLQMAGVVIRRLQRHRPSRRPRFEVGQHFGNVAALRGKRLRAFGVCRIVAQQVTVPLHRRPAAGGVDHDGVDVGSLERIDQSPRGRHRVLLFAGVFRQRSAAPCVCGNHHLAAFRREHSRGRLVDICRKIRAARIRAASPTRLPLRALCRNARRESTPPKLIGGSSRSIA